MNILDFGMTIQEAIEAPRFRLAGEPNFYKTGAKVTMSLESRFPPAVVQVRPLIRPGEPTCQPTPSTAYISLVWIKEISYPPLASRYR